MQSQPTQPPVTLAPDEVDVIFTTLAEFPWKLVSRAQSILISATQRAQSQAEPRRATVAAVPLPEEGD